MGNTGHMPNQSGCQDNRHKPGCLGQTGTYDHSKMTCAQCQSTADVVVIK